MAYVSSNDIDSAAAEKLTSGRSAITASPAIE